MRNSPANYIAKATNVLGGTPYEVSALFIDGEWEFTHVHAIPDTQPTRMDDETFRATYEPVGTPAHTGGPAVSAPIR